MKKITSAFWALPFILGSVTTPFASEQDLETFRMSLTKEISTSQLRSKTRQSLGRAGDVRKAAAKLDACVGSDEESKKCAGKVRDINKALSRAIETNTQLLSTIANLRDDQKNELKTDLAAWVSTIEATIDTLDETSDSLDAVFETDEGNIPSQDEVASIALVGSYFATIAGIVEQLTKIYGTDFVPAIKSDSINQSVRKLFGLQENVVFLGQRLQVCLQNTERKNCSREIKTLRFALQTHNDKIEDMIGVVGSMGDTEQVESQKIHLSTLVEGMAKAFQTLKFIREHASDSLGNEWVEVIRVYGDFMARTTILSLKLASIYGTEFITPFNNAVLAR